MLTLPSRGKDTMGVWGLLDFLVPHLRQSDPTACNLDPATFQNVLLAQITEAHFATTFFENIAG